MIFHSIYWSRFLVPSYHLCEWQIFHDIVRTLRAMPRRVDAPAAYEILKPKVIDRLGSASSGESAEEDETPRLDTSLLSPPQGNPNSVPKSTA
jgi:hypothetical protein